MLNRTVFGQGRVTYDTIKLDPSLSLEHQLDSLTEDLIQVEYGKGILLDVGWYPPFSPQGRFRVQVVRGFNWSRPLYDQTCVDLRLLPDVIRRGAQIAETLGGGTLPLPISLLVENHPAVSAPEWSLVVDAILNMDGCGTTLVCLEHHTGPTLMIGGGNDGRYLAEYLADPETQESYVLTDPTLGGGEVELCCGGQHAGYPAHWCAGLPLVLEAAHHFCTTGSMAPDLSWEEDR